MGGLLLAGIVGCQDTTGERSAEMLLQQEGQNGGHAVGLQTPQISTPQAQYFVNLIQEPNEQKPEEEEFSPIFEGWDKPELVLFITGRQHGYIEPCGCAGLDQMKGGLMRRHALLKVMLEKGWPVVKLDMGDQVHRLGPQAQIKLESTYKALRGVMGYDAIGLGPGELGLDPFPVYSILLNTAAAEETVSPFVSANAAIYDDRDQVPQFQVIERNGYKVGVTSVVSHSFFKGIDTMEEGRDVTIASPEDALNEVVPKLMAEKCQVNILLAYVPEEESVELAKKYPQFNFIVNEGVEGEPDGNLDYIDVDGRKVGIMQMGYKSMFAGAIGIYKKDGQPVRYQKIPLDHRFTDTEPMKEMFKNYQMALENKGLKELVGDPVPHPSGWTYVGSEACAECHEDAYDVWANGTKAWKEKHPDMPGPHSKATKDLVLPGERTWVKRHHDPECLSCHVTGWNPQQYFAYRSGYWDFEKDQALHGSGCENCHGPGSQHVAIENGDIEVSEEEAKKVLNAIFLDKKVAQQDLCATCHDLNNSPQFDFDSYWPMIEH